MGHKTDGIHSTAEQVKSTQDNETSGLRLISPLRINQLQNKLLPWIPTVRHSDILVKFGCVSFDLCYDTVNTV